MQTAKVCLPTLQEVNEELGTLRRRASLLSSLRRMLIKQREQEDIVRRFRAGEGGQDPRKQISHEMAPAN